MALHVNMSGASVRDLLERHFSTQFPNTELVHLHFGRDADGPTAEAMLRNVEPLRTVHGAAVAGFGGKAG